MLDLEGLNLLESYNKIIFRQHKKPNYLIFQHLSNYNKSNQLNYRTTNF